MKNQTIIPFLDLGAAHRDHKEAFVRVFANALETGRFIGGPEVSRFENEFAAFCGSQHCVGVGNGTDAVRLALIASGVSPSDSVVTVPHTFIATAEAISQAGCYPEFVDVNERTMNMSATSLRRFLERGCVWKRRSRSLISRTTGRRISAILPVHLYGQTADMDAILRLAARYELMVVEDACQAHGARYYSREFKSWRRAGTMGDAAAFSFYPGKNLGAFGEAGAVTTNNERLARRVRMLRDHGQAEKYIHQVEGFNARLDAIQAGVLRIKLRHLEEWNKARRQLARRYTRLLRPIEVIRTPHEPYWSESVFHLYVIRTPARDEVARHLASEGVATGLHYPIPLHLQQAYAHLGHKRGDFPNSESAARECLSLPIYPQLDREQQEHVVAAISRAPITAERSAIGATARASTA